SSTIYISFKQADGEFQVLPQPPPDAQEIKFTYMSRWWVADASTTTPASDAPTAADQVILSEPVLITKLLKLRLLEAKGFDTSAALSQFLNVMSQWTGKDTSTQVLNMARVRVFPYLGWRNVPEANYGLP